MGDWTFFSNYGHVLVCLARNREARLRDVAAEVGITERAVQKIVHDLQEAGFLTISKQGRCNRYRINRRKSLRHDLESHITVGKLLTLIARAVPQEPVEKTAETAADTPLDQPTDVGQISSDEQGSGKKSKPERQAPPADTRQQGSLF